MDNLPPNAPPNAPPVQYDYEFEERIETRGKILQWGLVSVVGLVALVSAGIFLHSRSSRDSHENRPGQPMYISPASYSTNK